MNRFFVTVALAALVSGAPHASATHSGVAGSPCGGGLHRFSGTVAGGGETDGWLWISGHIPEPPCIVVDLIDFVLFGNHFQHHCQ